LLEGERLSPSSRPWTPVILGLVGVAYYAPLIFWTVGDYDEGVMVYGAVRVLQGQVPYRDFWSMYAPGQFYLLAGLFKLFHPSLSISRVWEVLVRAAIPVLCYLIARPLAGRKPALIVWVLTLCWLWQFQPTNYPAFPALAMSLSSCLLVTWWLHAQDRIGMLFWAGVAAGVSVIFRQDIGAVTAGAQAGVVALTLGTRRKDVVPIVRALAVSISGVAFVLIPAVLALVASVPRAALIQDLITFPATLYPMFRAIPYPSLHDWLAVSLGPAAILVRLPPLLARLFVASVPVAILLGWALLWAGIRRGILSGTQALSLALLLTMAVGFTAQMVVRTDYTHMLPVSLPLLVAIPVLLIGVSPSFARAAAASLIVLAAGAGVALAASGYTELGVFRRCRQPAASADVARRLGFACASAEEIQAATYLEANVPQDQLIFVGSTRHDRVLVGNSMLYFLAGRNSATSFHEMHAGLTTTQPVQQAIIADLERARVKRVVRTAGGFWVEPNASRFSSGVTLLDDYLDARFERERQFGPYTIYMRR
jgi:hypothetical protein